jgi:glutamyl-tRNA reductase
MFNFFRKKTEIEKLQAQYKKLMEEGYALSTSNRKESYLKYAQAEVIMTQIEKLSAKSAE